MESANFCTMWIFASSGRSSLAAGFHRKSDSTEKRNSDYVMQNFDSLDQKGGYTDLTSLN